MFRKTTHGVRRRLGSQAAIALVLAAGGLVALPAEAQRVPRNQQNAPEQPRQGDADSNTRGFADAYTPFIAIVNDPAGDMAAAKAMVPSVRAAIGNDADKSTLGNALIVFGNKLSDKELQKEGITLLLESGKATPEQTGVFHYYLGRWASEDKNYPEARRHLQASYDAGYREGEPDVLIADTYFNEGRNAEGLDYLYTLLQERIAAGRTVSDSWIVRGLSVANNARMADQALAFSELLLSTNPSSQSWLDVIGVTSGLNPLDQHSQLDLLRLMRATNTLTEPVHYSQYLEAAKTSGLPNEVLAVLAEGLAKGVFTASDPTYVEYKSEAEPRAAADRADAPGMSGEAQAAANGRVALGIANALYSMERWAEAEGAFKAALEKGVEDRPLALMRLGMTQVNQGKYAEARATLDQVTGSRAPVARIWNFFAKTKAGSGA